jgi:hypothetical protein
MTNFTVAIPDDLLADAKVCAAKAGTSVNSILRVLLEGFVRNESAPLSGNSEILFKYSLGQMTEQKAMKLLHLDDEEDLRLMVLRAGLPLPRLSEQETEVMSKKFGEMIERFGAATS